MKKTLALLLALLCTAGSLAACGEGEKESDNPGVNPGTSGNQEETQPEETEKPTPNWDAVDKTSLGGTEINTINRVFDPAGEYIALDFAEYTSDVLDKAIFERNRLLESTLDCKFIVTELENGEIVDTVKQSIEGGDGSVDLAYTDMYNIGVMLTNGLLMPFNFVETVDMTQPWWDQTLMDDARVSGMDYFGYIDFSFAHYDSMQVIYYNGKILEKYPEMEDPYDLYKNKQWTMEKMMEMAEEAAEDVNGDGTMDIETDQFGIGGSTCERMPMVLASGLHPMEWSDEEQVHKLMMNDERYINVLEMIVKMRGKNVPFNSTKSKSSIAAFQQGRILFLTTDLSTFKTLRSLEDDYGLIPHPTYDYTVDEHYNFVPGPEGFCFPINIGDDNGDGKDDYSEIGTFLQAAGAYTYDVVLDAYIEKSVIGKGLRDQKSVEIFYDMIQNRSTCVSFAYQTYGMAELTNLATDRDEGFASAINGFQAKFDAYAKRLAGVVLEQKATIEAAFGK